MTPTETNKVKFENKVGLELISKHTFNEDVKTVWNLRVCRFKDSGNKSWYMWCERNNQLVRGTEENGTNLSKDLKEMFKLNNNV